MKWILMIGSLSLCIYATDISEDNHCWVIDPTPDYCL